MLNATSAGSSEMDVSEDTVAPWLCVVEGRGDREEEEARVMIAIGWATARMSLRRLVDAALLARVPRRTMRGSGPYRCIGQGEELEGQFHLLIIIILLRPRPPPVRFRVTARTLLQVGANWGQPPS